ncbi:unnamed protein product [Sphagnum jensenii]|uniref:Uncharacterized protein n=1 Tax=Sphagnum jensenii TaxID=128206 RepID=A0ABP1A5Z4_9BRYO
MGVYVSRLMGNLIFRLLQELAVSTSTLDSTVETDPGVDAEVWEVTGISKSQNMREVLLMTNEECVL